MTPFNIYKNKDNKSDRPLNNGLKSYLKTGSYQLHNLKEHKN